MSEHDPLCPYAHVSGPSCEICDLIRQAEKRGRQGDWWVRGHKAGYEQGQRDALADAVKRVEALNAERGYDMTSEFYSETGNDYAEGWVDLLGLVIAAIKGWYTHTSDDCPMRGQSDYVGCAICDKGDSDE